MPYKSMTQLTHSNTAQQQSSLVVHDYPVCKELRIFSSYAQCLEDYFGGSHFPAIQQSLA